MSGGSCNIDRKGRLIRFFLGGLSLVCAVILWLAVGGPWVWGAVMLAALGAFTLYEAARGWCALRAMGIRTPW